MTNRTMRKVRRRQMGHPPWSPRHERDRSPFTLPKLTMIPVADMLTAGALGLLGGTCRPGLAVKLDGAAIKAESAIEDLDHCRLAGAVLADKGHHFRRHDLQMRGGKRRNTPEGLVDGTHG